MLKSSFQGVECEGLPFDFSESTARAIPLTFFFGGGHRFPTLVTLGLEMHPILTILKTKPNKLDPEDHTMNEKT